jgi:uncharacterized protein (TIGR03435 family)
MANVLFRMEKTATALVFAACTFGGIHSQTPQPAPPKQAQTKPPLAFDVVSVKPAPPGTIFIVPAFMRDKGARILGVQRILVPVNALVGYAYGMQMSEALAAFRKQPDWTRNKAYAVTFRAAGEPTRDQVREMMRTMLAERFALQVHEFTMDGTVDKFVLNKPGVLGPNLKPHPADASCTRQDGSSVGHAPDAATPPIAYCGVFWYYLPGQVLHEEVRDTTIAALAPVLSSLGDNGLGTHPVVDATGLTGKYDATLEFRPSSMTPFSNPEADDGGVPSLLRALKEQLGIRVESGEGPVRRFVIEHIAQPTPD